MAHWIIDPAQKTVITYHFENNDAYAVYTFRDRIPVGIFGGELVIDFSQIDDAASGWM